jgi:hypothetical protein
MDESWPAAGNFKLDRDEWGRLVLTDGVSQRRVPVQAMRAFPISNHHHAISICDQEGQELLFLDSLDEVPPDTRAILEMELAQREFVPIIRRILNNPPDTEPTQWRVETDRGVTTFELERDSDVYRSDSNQVTIVDSHGIRYLILDLAALDARSRRVIDRFVC